MGDYLLFHLSSFKHFFYNEKALFCSKEKVALSSFKTFTIGVGSLLQEYSENAICGRIKQSIQKSFICLLSINIGKAK